CEPGQLRGPCRAGGVRGNFADAGTDGAAGGGRGLAGGSGGGSFWDSLRGGPFARGGGGGGASRLVRFGSGVGGGGGPGAAGDYFYLSVCGPVRQRGNDGGRVRAGRLPKGRKNPARGTHAAGRWNRYNFWGYDGYVDGDELYRKRGWRGSGSAHGVE